MNYRITKHSSKHSKVSNQRNGWKENTRKFQRENARSRRCCYFDKSRYLCRREELGSHLNGSFSLGSRLRTILFVPTEAIPPAFASAKPYIKRQPEHELHGSANSSTYINQSSIPYNDSAICVIPGHLSSDLLTHEIWTTGGQYRTLSHISLWWEKDLAFHIMRMKTATGGYRSCQISTSLLSGISWCCLFKFPGHLLASFAFSPRCQHTKF